MWTLKSFISEPSKIVRPVPTIPGLISSIGIRLVVAGTRTQPKAARATVRRKTRIFMVCNPL